MTVGEVVGSRDGSLVWIVGDIVPIIGANIHKKLRLEYDIEVMYD